MATRAPHPTTRSPQYVLGPSADLPIARIVVLAMIVVGLVALLVVLPGVLAAPPSETTKQLANFNPRALFSDDRGHFLPPPVAALPAEPNAEPPPPATEEVAGATTERGRIANTGGIGAVLRAEPKGRPLGSLRDGQLVQVLEHRDTGDGDEWVRVKAQDGAEGWVWGRLVGPGQ